MAYWLRSSVLLLLISLVWMIAPGQVPPPPANLSVSQGMMGSALLRWDTSSGAQFYRVYKGTDDTTFLKLGETLHPEFLDYYLLPHTKYFYFVRGVNLQGEGASSDTVWFQLDSTTTPPVHGAVQGMVVDDNTGLPIRNAFVNFFNLNTLWPTSIHTDSAGNYRALLDTGSYYLLAAAFGYLPEWFDNTVHLDSARALLVRADSTSSANFGLRPYPLPRPVSMSGTVRDSSTALPIPHAAVIVMRSFREFRRLCDATGLFSGYAGERFDLGDLGRFEGVVWAGLTDSSGNYSATLLTGFHYVALAFKPGYELQFYDRKFTPFDADRIALSQDTTGIDFSLSVNPLAANSLSGSVVDSLGDGIPSHVVLFRRTVAGLIPVRYRMTDSTGGFTFGQLVAGVFMIKAYPLIGYAPAWYSASGCGVRSWHNADTIHVSGIVTGTSVCVQPAPEGGFGMISGQITLVTVPSAGKTPAVSTALPAGGVTVYAISAATNSVVSTDVTEQDGNYSLGNLPPGSYSVVADKEGCNGSSIAGVSLGQGNGFQSPDNAITMTPELTLSVRDVPPSIPSSYRLEQNFPNPFNPTTVIRFALPAPSRVALKIYNLIGQQVVTLVHETRAAGVYSVAWNATDNNHQQVGSGIYFVKMTAEPISQHAKPFNQVRKMILLR